MPLVLGPLLVPLLAFLAAIVLVGLSQASTSQHGSADSGSFWDFITGRQYFHQVSGFAAKFARWVVSRFAAGQLRMLARWLVAMGTLSSGWFTGNAVFAEAITTAVERVWHAIPGEIHKLVHPVRLLARHALHTATHALRLANSTVHALHRFEVRANHRLHVVEHTIAVTLPHEIGRIRTGERALEREYRDLRGRVRTLENGAIKAFEWLRTHPRSAAMGAFTAVVSVALARLGYGFLRCRDWQKVGKSLTCGMGRWVGELLGLIATFALGGLSVLKPEVLAEAAVAAVDEIEPILAAILRD